MRITLISAVGTALAIAAFAFTYGYAQQQVPPRAGVPTASHQGVAVIDITYILDNHPRLKAATDRFKSDVQNTGMKFKSEQEAIAKQAEKLRTLKPGSPDYKRLEEELTQKQSDLKVKASLEEKEFAERESQMYLAAYTEVCALVRAYAERNGIKLVLRFNGKPVDRNNRDAIRAELFKTVVYNDPAIDITDPVLNELKRAAAAAAPTATRPARPVAQPPRRQ